MERADRQGRADPAVEFRSADFGHRTATVEMNFVELFSFLLGVALTVVIGRFLFPYMGWWAALPVPILGFGLIVILIVGLNRLALRRHPNGGEGPDR